MFRKKSLDRKIKTNLEPSDTSNQNQQKRKKVLSLLKQIWRIEFGQISWVGFVKKYRIGGAAILVGIATFVYFTILPSEATIAVYYPDRCLGGWENVENAQGEPQVKDNDIKKFNASNSAVLHDRVTQIYCGGFSGEIPDNGVQKNIHLKFSWASISPKTTTPTTEVNPQEDFTHSSTTTISPASHAFSTTTTNETETDSSETEPTVIAPSSAPEPAPEPEPEPTSEPVVESSPEQTTESPAVAPESTPEPASVSEPVSAPPPPADPTPTPPPADPAPAAAAATALLFAQADESSEEVTSSTSAEVSPASSTAEEIAAVLPSEPSLFEILYTTDGKKWNSIGKISESQLDEAVFDIPLEAIPTWSDLSKIQINVKSIETLSEDVTVYLDSMWLEVEYDILAEKELTAEELEKLPRVKVESDKFFKSFKKVYKADENIEVQISPVETKIENTELATSTDTVVSTSTEVVVPPPPILEPEQTMSASSTETSFLQQKNYFKLISGLINVALASNKPNPSTRQHTPKVLSAKIRTEQGEEVAITPVITTTTKGELSISFSKKEKSFRPGKYTINFEILQDNIIYESSEEFLWGVLAVNLNKSIYKVGEVSYIQVAALTEEGHTLCNADLDLTITGPGLEPARFTTANATLLKSGDCGHNNVTDTPDYFAHYILTVPGTYSITLKNNANGYSIEDSFNVEDSVTFSVQRQAATRINPSKSTYTMRMKIATTKNFNGSITETVPKNFEIASSNDYDVHDLDDKKVIVWQKKLASGDTIDLQYTYQAPIISPQFYLLGPLVLSESPAWYKRVVGAADTVSFIEAREWQIASDAVTSYKAATTLVSNDGCTAPSGGNFTNDNPPTTVATHLWQCDSDNSPNVEDSVQLSGFDFQLSSTSVQIDGIVVHLNDVSLTSSGAGTQDFKVRLSWDGGTSWTSSAQNDATTCSTGDISSTAADGAEYYCSGVSSTAGTSDPASGTTWGHTWTASELSSTNFVVQVTADNDSNTARVQRFDIAEVKVYYSLMPTMVSAANQTFAIGDSSTAISQITVTDVPGIITTTNDIRISIATSTHGMLWDTTDTSVTLGGTASGKVSSTVSYEGGGSVLVLNVTTNLAANDTLTVSGLSFKDFTAAAAPTAGVLKLYTGGASDVIADASDTRTIAIKGSETLANHNAGQVTDRFENGETSTTTTFYAFKLTNTGETSSSTLTFDLSGITGMANGDFTNTAIYPDADGDGIVSTSTSWAVAYDTTETTVTSMTIDTDNNILYVGTSDTGLILRCPLSTDCDASGDFSVSYDTPDTEISGMAYDSTQNVLYAATDVTAIVYRCEVSTGCDASGDWTVSFDSSSTGITSLTYSLIKNYMYATVLNDAQVRHCNPETTLCDASGDWGANTPNNSTARLRSMAESDLYIYAGNGTNGNVVRCDPVVQTVCGDGASDWVLSLDTAAGEIFALAADTTNDVMYAGADDGSIYRCAESTTCDDSTDWTTVYTDGSGTDVRSLAFNANTGIMYAGFDGGTILKCAVSTGCDASSEWTTSLGTSLTTRAMKATSNGVTFAGTGSAGELYRLAAAIEPVFSSPTISIVGTTGTMRFTSTSTLASGAINYLLYSTVSNIASGDSMTLALSTSNIISYGNTSLQKLAVAGSASNITHTSSAAPTITVSGTIYSDDGSTTYTTAGKTITLKVAGAGAYSTTTVAGTGVWRINNITQPAIGNPVEVWVDGDATMRAFAMTKASSTSNNITGLDLYQNRVIVKHEGTSGTSTTIADLAVYDSDNDADIQFTANNGALSVSKGQELHIWTGKTFAPGGAITLHGNAAAFPDGAMHIDDNAILTAGGDISVAGGWAADTGSTYTAGNNTLTFTATTTGKTIAGVLTGNSALGTTTFNGSGGGWTFSNNASTTKLTITAGTVTAPSLLSISGDYSNSGTFTHNSGTTTFDGSLQQTLSGTMTGTSAFGNLEVKNNSGSDPDTSPSLIFSGAASSTNMTMTTASTKVRFNAGSGYTFTNINWNGQAAGTRVALRSSSGGTPWKLYVTGTQVVKNVDVKDSNASGGNEIDATDSSNLNSTGNTNWNFGGTVSCDTTPASVEFSGLALTGVSTASPTATTTLSCSVAAGCTLSVSSTGNGSDAGLYKSSAPTHLILSATATLSAGTDGYGIQAATTTSGSGGTILIASAFNKTGNNVGGLTTSNSTLASVNTTITDREVVVTYKAAVSPVTPTGTYSDITTISCVAN